MVVFVVTLVDYTAGGIVQGFFRIILGFIFIILGFIGTLGCYDLRRIGRKSEAQQ
jgi:hypothetical protein